MRTTVGVDDATSGCDCAMSGKHTQISSEMPTSH